MSEAERLEQRLLGLQKDAMGEEEQRLLKIQEALNQKVEHRLLKSILRMLMIPGGSVVLETLPNGKQGLGFRFKEIK